MSTILNPETIFKITVKEKKITGFGNAFKGGPTTEAQKHVGGPIIGNISKITSAEKEVAGQDHAVKGGLAALAQSELDKSESQN